MALVEDIIAAVRHLQSQGMQYAELSDENLRVLGHSPSPAATQTSPAPSPQNISQRRDIQAAAPQAAAASEETAPIAVSDGRPMRRSVIPTAQPAPIELPPASHPDCPPPPDMSSASWEELVQACCNCKSCPLGTTRTNIVIEDGSRQADLMFIGEGPGADEDAQGVPFVGRAGQLLTKMLSAMGRTRDANASPEQSVYIANIVKCRPPQNRVPYPDEAGPCLGYLHRQIELVHPKVIVLLGATPLLYLLRQKGIMRCRGHWYDYKGIPVMPTFHPAYILRFERSPEQFITVKRQVWADLQEVMKKLSGVST